MGAETERSSRSIPTVAGLCWVPLAGLALLLLCARPAGADVYRWVDEQGTIHFTDELSNVPPDSRKSAIREVSKAPESGGSLSVLGTSPLPSPGGPGEYAPPPSGDTTGFGSDRENLLSRIEQLQAKIDAKEAHIRAVDDKQSLATNPLRNRYVDESDLALYKKYQEELPADREELSALEDALSSLR